MSNFIKKTPILIILGLILSQFTFLHKLFAQHFDYVTGTVKIAICGDGVIEGPEDCEGEDLNGETCESLGYQSGTLSCDIACDFDTSDCVPYPTPTPTMTPTPTLTPTNTPTLTPTVTPEAEPTSEVGLQTVELEESVEEELPTATNTPIPPTPTPILPRLVSVFDLDKSGKIELSEMALSLRTWVEDFYQYRIKKLRKEKHICDLNEDGTCNLVDFSILLYYVERE